MGAGYWKEECLEISSDNALLGSQRNLKDPLSRLINCNLSRNLFWSFG